MTDRAVANLVHQTSITTGTGDFTLSAVNGKQSFNSAFGTGGSNLFDYFISNQSAAEWERGTGHLSAANTLVRDTVIESTNANAAVSFSAGTKDVTNDVPAASQVQKDLAQTLTNKTYDTASNTFKINGTTVSDKTGTGKAVLDTSPTISNPVVGTQSARDNSTKAASTSYVDTATREKLTADRTYYVRSDGSDSNNGLANTSGGAFLTPQKAYDTALTLDLAGFTVTIQLGDATYASGISISKPVLGGSVIINGNSGTPTNVVISASVPIDMNCAGSVTVQNMRLQGSFASIRCQNPGGIITFGAGLSFAGTPSSGHILISDGQIQAGSNNFTIASSAIRWLSVSKGIFLANSSTITFSGTPAWSGEGIYFDIAGTISLFSVTMSGSATGKRYSGTMTAQLQSFGAGTASTYFPGNSNGSTATGAQQA